MFTTGALCCWFVQRLENGENQRRFLLVLSLKQAIRESDERPQHHKHQMLPTPLHLCHPLSPRNLQYEISASVIHCLMMTLMDVVVVGHLSFICKEINFLCESESSSMEEMATNCLQIEEEVQERMLLGL